MDCLRGSSFGCSTLKKRKFYETFPLSIRARNITTRGTKLNVRVFLFPPVSCPFTLLEITTFLLSTPPSLSSHTLEKLWGEELLQSRIDLFENE